MSRERVQEIITQVPYLTLATVGADGHPWNSPLWTAYDDAWNFFWTSSPNAQHSQNITAEPRVYIVIFDSAQAEGTGEGVFLQGRAEELTDREEIAHAVEVFYRRKNKSAREPEDFLGDSPRRMYRFTPEKCWINTYEKIRGFGVDGREEIQLKPL